MEIVTSPSGLQREFAPLIAAQLTARQRPGHVLTPRGYKAQVAQPLADLESDFDPRVLRSAINETIARSVVASAGARWPNYTRRLAEAIVTSDV